MNRRDAIKMMMAGVGAALAIDAEAAPGEDVAGAIARLRRRLARTAELDLGFLPIPGRLPAAAHERAEIDAGLIRSSMRALLVTGAVMDLGEENRDHPEVKRLLAEVGPELDYAVEGSLYRLHTLPGADRQRIQREVRRNPDVVEAVAMKLEHLAGRGGASTPRRLHLRKLLQHASWRLCNQPLDEVLGDAVDKTLAQAGRLPREHRGASGGPWTAALGRMKRSFPVELPRTGAGASQSKSAAPDVDRLGHLRRRARDFGVAGAGLAGLGALLVGVGAGTEVFGLAILGSFVLTAAVVLLVMTLVTLVVAAAAARAAVETESMRAMKAEVEALRAEKRAREASAEPKEPTDSTGSVAPDNGKETSFVLVQTGGWVPTGLMFEIGTLYRIDATPRDVNAPSVYGDGSAAGPDAPAPGLPRGAAVGRIGTQVWLLGEGIEISGVEGSFEVAVNNPADPGVMSAPYRVRVRWRRVE
jgi:hypothetical protein